MRRLLIDGRHEGTTSSSKVGLCFLLSAACVAACSGFGAADSTKPGEGGGTTPQVPGGGPAAPPIVGSPDASELNETFGVFVAVNGRADGAGSRTLPLASIQAGIDLGKRTGKRVYVCTGTFHEAIALADSISVIGGLDCAIPTEWKIGTSPTRVESPTSPALVAKGIATATRIDGLDIVAPNAVDPGSSSVGLIAENSKALVVANSQISAGDATKGSDGTDGVQLTQMGTLNGFDVAGADECVLRVTCDVDKVTGLWLKPDPTPGGTSVCAGEPNHDGESGGAGGIGGLQEVYSIGASRFLQPYQNNNFYLYHNGDARAGGQAEVGREGANAPPVGTFSSTGYAPADGSAGTNGGTGKGGAGGNGSATLSNPASYPVGDVFRGNSGAGGGAGGCPGLAGTAGKGGGASIGALLLQSDVTFDGTRIASGRGGDPGHGTLGSTPTAGGAAGANPFAAQLPANSGRGGSNGGTAGISGNGSSGPSIGIVHAGPAPTIRGTTKIVPGAGGAGIDASVRTDNLGNSKTIPATPAGLSKDILPL